MILRVPLHYLVPGKPLPIADPEAREIEAILDERIMGYRHVHGPGGVPLRASGIDGAPILEGALKAVPRYLRDATAAVALIGRAPVFFAFRDDAALNGGRGWFQVRMVPEENPEFAAYQPDFARALSQAALILVAHRAAQDGKLEPIVIDVEE